MVSTRISRAAAHRGNRHALNGRKGADPMAWHIITDRDGRRWAYNNDGVYLLLRTAVRATLVKRYTTTVGTDHGFLLPTTWCVETDWGAVRRDLDAETQRYWATAELGLRQYPRVMLQNLGQMLRDARSDIAWLQAARVAANGRSSSNIDSVVSGWEYALKAAQFVRDASATILVVTAGIVSGGTGLAAATAIGMTEVTAGTAMTTLAVGSAMRGAFTYQDTGNVGSAAVNAIGTFSVGAIGIGAAGATMSSAEQTTILVIQSTGQGMTTGGQALIEGRNASDAARAAAVSAGFGFAGGAIGARVGNMSFVGQVAVNGVADLSGNIASNAVIAPPDRPLPRPAVRGVDYGGLPASDGDDAAYLAANCLFQLPI